MWSHDTTWTKWNKMLWIMPKYSSTTHLYIHTWTTAYYPMVLKLGVNGDILHIFLEKGGFWLQRRILALYRNRLYSNAYTQLTYYHTTFLLHKILHCAFVQRWKKFFFPLSVETFSVFFFFFFFFFLLFMVFLFGSRFF